MSCGPNSWRNTTKGFGACGRSASDNDRNGTVSASGISMVCIDVDATCTTSLHTAEAALNNMFNMVGNLCNHGRFLSSEAIGHKALNQTVRGREREGGERWRCTQTCNANTVAAYALRGIPLFAAKYEHRIIRHKGTEEGRGKNMAASSTLRSNAYMVVLATSTCGMITGVKQKTKRMACTRAPFTWGRMHRGGKGQTNRHRDETTRTRAGATKKRTASDGSLLTAEWHS